MPILRVGVKRMGPDFFQWCPATGQGATGTNWSTGSSIWTWGRSSSLCGRRSTGTGYPGKLWNLLLWRYSKHAWTRSCAACCRRLCFGRGVGLVDPQRSLPTPTILWFCETLVLLLGHLLFSPGRCEWREKGPLFLMSQGYHIDCLLNFTAANYVKLIKCVS